MMFESFKQRANWSLGGIIFLIFLIFAEEISDILTKFMNLFLVLIPVLVAYWLYVQTQRGNAKNELKKENNTIRIVLMEIKKNNEWCEEYKKQGITQSIKFYNLTKIGVERCLNTLVFKKNDKRFLEAFYMCLKLIGIVNNIIKAIIITGQNFNPNLINMANKSIKESRILKFYLINRFNNNVEQIPRI